MSLAVPQQSAKERIWIRPSLLFAAFSLIAWISLHLLGGQKSFLIVWPANAVALAIALPAWEDRRLRFWTVFAAFLGYLAAAELAGSALWIAFWLAVVSAIELWLSGTLLSVRLFSFEDLKEVKNVIYFSIVVLLVTAGCAELGAYPLSALAHASIAAAWAHIVEGNALGLLTLFPALFFLTSGKYRSYRELRPYLRSGILWMLIYTSVVAVVFYQSSLPVLFFIFPPLIGLLFVWGTEGAAFALVIVTLIGSWLTSLGHGPISVISYEPLELRILIFQCMVATVFVIALPVGALLDERRLASRQVAEAQNIYSTLIGHTNDMIILASYKGDRRFVSRAVTQLTGWSEKEYLEFGLEGPVHPRDREIVDSMLAQLRLDESTQTRRFRLLRKDGSYGWYEASATGYVDPISLDIAGFVATMHDIGELMEKEFSWSAERAALSRERSKLQDLAWKDELTGIANRRSFNELLRFEAGRKVRSKAPLSLLMIDIDFFKLFNDKLGHQAGDVCLRTVAAAMQTACSRVTDSPARIGGEEFAVLLAATDAEGAARVGEKIREAVYELNLEHPGSPMGRVTVSIGVASLPEGSFADTVQLMHAADQALYVSKKQGRNQVTRGESPVVEIADEHQPA